MSKFDDSTSEPQLESILRPLGTVQQIQTIAKLMAVAAGWARETGSTESAMGALENSAARISRMAQNALSNVVIDLRGIDPRLSGPMETQH